MYHPSMVFYSCAVATAAKLLEIPSRKICWYPALALPEKQPCLDFVELSYALQLLPIRHNPSTWVLSIKLGLVDQQLLISSDYESICRLSSSFLWKTQECAKLTDKFLEFFAFQCVYLRQGVAMGSKIHVALIRCSNFVRYLLIICCYRPMYIAPNVDFRYQRKTCGINKYWHNQFMRCLYLYIHTIVISGIIISLYYTF